MKRLINLPYIFCLIAMAFALPMSSVAQEDEAMEGEAMEEAMDEAMEGDAMDDAMDETMEGEAMDEAMDEAMEGEAMDETMEGEEAMMPADGDDDMDESDGEGGDESAEE